MSREQSKAKSPLSREAIYRIMVSLSYIVSAFFLIKDLAGGETMGAVLIVACMAAFSLVLLAMKILKFSKDRKRFVVSIGLIVLIFFISLGSGNYYSDDYAMYLAALGLTGLYLRPKYTAWQLVASTILMVLQFIIFPQKADPLGQFIMCMLTFVLAGSMIYLCIHRGHQFILANETKDAEAAQLLKSLGNIGTKLSENLQDSATRTDSMNEANSQLSNHAEELERGSENISAEANMVAVACEEVQSKIQTMYLRSYQPEVPYYHACHGTLHLPASSGLPAVSKNILRFAYPVYSQILRCINRPFFGRYPCHILSLSGFCP